MLVLRSARFTLMLLHTQSTSWWLYNSSCAYLITHYNRDSIFGNVICVIISVHTQVHIWADEEVFKRKRRTLNGDALLSAYPSPTINQQGSANRSFAKKMSRKDKELKEEATKWVALIRGMTLRGGGTMKEAVCWCPEKPVTAAMFKRWLI